MKFKQMICAALAVAMLGGNASSSVYAVDTFADTGGAAVKTGPVADNTNPEAHETTETSAEKPETADGSDTNTEPAMKETEGHSADKERETQETDPDKGKEILQNEEDTAQEKNDDSSFDTEQDEDIPEEENADEEDGPQQGNVFFVLENEGGILTLYDGDDATFTASWTERGVSLADPYGNTADVSDGSAVVYDSEEREIFSGDAGSFMTCGDGTFAIQDEGRLFLVADGALVEAGEGMEFIPLPYTDNGLMLVFTGEEGEYLPFSVSAADGYELGEWAVPSDADVSGTEHGFTGSAVCMGTEMNDGNTFRFSFDGAEEKQEGSPKTDTDDVMSETGLLKKAARTAVRGEPLVVVHIDGKRSSDDVQYEEGIGLEYVSIQNEEGRYLTFGEDWNMSGLSDEPAYYGIRGTEDIYVPRGTYRLSFRDENRKYPDRHRIEDEYTGSIPKEEAIYYCTDRMLYNPQISAVNDENTYEIRAVYTRADIHFFYLDTTSGTKPPIYFQFPRDPNPAGVEPMRFTKTETEEGDLIYTYDMENGTEEWMAIEANRRTIVRDAPAYAFGIKWLIPDEGWSRTFGISLNKANMRYWGKINGIDYNSSIDSWGYTQSAICVNAEDAFSVRQYHKRGAGKPTVEAEFCLATESFESSADESRKKRYVLDHYDTYEYAGKIYRNVYVPKKEVKPWNTTDEDTVIHTENGDFTVFLPNYTPDGNKWYIHEEGEGRFDQNLEYYLIELETEKGFFQNNDYTYIYPRGFNINRLRLYDKRTGSAPDVNQFSLSRMSVEDIGLRFESGEQYCGPDDLAVVDDELDCVTGDIFNDAYPKLKKTVTNDYISPEQPFKFEIWARRQNSSGQYGYIRLDTVTLKNGEEMFIDPEDVDGITPSDAAYGYFYVKEVDNDGWEAPSVTSPGTYALPGVEGAYTYYGYQYSRYVDQSVVIEFANTRKLNTITLKKSVTDGDRDHTHRFKVSLWDEVDGERYPFSGYTFNIGSASYSTDENGEVLIDIDTHLAEEAQVELSVPDRCHYKIEEVSSTLGTYSVEKTNSEGIVPEGGITSTWVNSYEIPDVVISKTDVNGHRIAGAQLKVTGREAGSLTDITSVTWTSAEGQDKTIQLRPGSYTLSETAVPESGLYAKADDITFTVGADGKIKAAGEDVSKVIMVDEYNISSLRVKKTVSGDMGNKNDKFNFSMALKDSEDAIYTRPISYRKGEDIGILVPDGNGKVAFTLSHGETIEFTDLLIGTKYEVTEADYSEEGYTTVSENASGTIAKENPDAEFVNSKNMVVPTGIAQDFPWMIWIVTAAGIAYIAAVKKRKA